MCPSFTRGTASVHYLLGLPLAYALRSATPNGLMLLVKLTYSPVLLRPIESVCLWSPMCFFLPRPHDTLSCSIFRLLGALLPSVPASLSPGCPLRLAFMASACSMATAHLCLANGFRVYCRTSSLTPR